MTKQPREFVDKDHEVMDVYYDLCERYNGRNATTIKKQLRGLIEKDPDFLDSYLLLHEILQNEGKLEEAEAALDQAFQRAIRLIADRKGQWPDELRWGWLENRHIIRTIVNKAISLWGESKNDEALDLFRKILRTNPNDNPCVRYLILGIRMGMGYSEFDKQFDRGGYWDLDIQQWFAQNRGNFPEEFDWWEKAIEEEE
ncbi:MAG: tetratricopeptide repeat protein [Candidatus Zixiibacteriota bacterium]